MHKALNQPEPVADYAHTVTFRSLGRTGEKLWDNMEKGETRFARLENQKARAKKRLEWDLSKIEKDSAKEQIIAEQLQRIRMEQVIAEITNATTFD